MRLYIDPGTGSMLFTILIGAIGALVYSVRMLFLKMRNKVGKSTVQEKTVPIIIFADDKRYFKIFEPVIRELAGRNIEILYLAASEDDQALSTRLPCFQAECIGKGNKAFARLNYLKGDILLSSTPGLEVYQWKRSKGIKFYVHIPHAASEITLYRMFGIDYYDAILLSGDYQAKDIRSLEALRSLPPKALPMIGIPYMDEMAVRNRQAGQVAPHEKTVLLAPSWGKSAIFSVWGDKILKNLLETGYHVIVRPHPQSFTSEKELMDDLMKAYPTSDRLEWNRDTDNFDVLRRSDILISDFSGVIFDFTLVYDKPVIYTDPDFDTGLYDAWWLKTPLWTISALPRLGRELTGQAMEDMKGLIDEVLTDPRYQEGRRQVKEETWANYGQGALCAADYLEKKLKELK